MTEHSIRSTEPGEDGKIARFSGQDTEYLLTWSCCENPECLCRDMTFVFTSLDEEGDDDAAFHATLNIDTWEESKPYQRPAWAESCAREFIAQLTEELKTEFREYFNAGKKQGRKISEFRIEPSEIMDGRRVAYSEVVGDRGSILKGGQSHWMTFRFEGVEYIVEDLYCMNPSCRCRDVRIVFLEVQQSPPELPRIRDAFDAMMTLSGVAKLVEAHDDVRASARTGPQI